MLFISVSTLTTQNIKTELNQYFSVLAENKQFNGNVLIAENGKVLYQKSMELNPNNENGKRILEKIAAKLLLVLS